MLGSRILFGISWILLLIAFSLPWYVTSTSRYHNGWYKELPHPLEPYLIGGKPYTGWGVLPLTIPSVMGFLLGGLVLFSKKSRPITAAVSGILMFIGVIFGMFGAPIIMKSWTGVWGGFDVLYATGFPGLAEGYWFAFAMSVIFLFGGIVIAFEKKKERPLLGDF